MNRIAHRAVLSGILGLSLIASACGSSGGGSPSPAARGSVTVGGFNFSESSILANIYGKALAGDGYKVSYKLNLGSREIVEPALERGDIDAYPGYAATELEFINSAKGEATPDAMATVNKLNTYLTVKGLKALAPSPAVDENAFVVTKATADKNGFKTISDMAKASDKLTLGGPPECPRRPFCQAGLDRVYGTHFKAFKSLDAGGPLTKAALDKGDIDVGLLFSSDGAIAAKGYVVLDDDKHLQNADNVVPVVRTKAVDANAQSLLNKLSAKLTTDDLVQMNKSASVDHQDPDVLAANWLKSHGFKAG